MHQAEDGSVDAEVAFWRGFIAWWAREKEEPVPERAWEALVDAEYRAALFEPDGMPVESPSSPGEH